MQQELWQTALLWYHLLGITPDWLSIPMQKPILIQISWRLGFTFRSAGLASYLFIFLFYLFTIILTDYSNNQKIVKDYSISFVPRIPHFAGCGNMQTNQNNKWHPAPRIPHLCGMGVVGWPKHIYQNFPTFRIFRMQVAGWGDSKYMTTKSWILQLASCRVWVVGLKQFQTKTSLPQLENTRIRHRFL